MQSKMESNDRGNDFVKTSEKTQDAVILSLTQKLKAHNIKPATIVHKCEQRDANKDNLLHQSTPTT